MYVLKSHAFDIIIYTICFILLAGSYIPSKESGHCGNSNGYAEHCWCETDFLNMETKCRSYCNNDYNCTGYAFADSSVLGPQYDCGFYTVSSCPAECDKYNEGVTGDLTTMPHAAFSGCYIKLGIVYCKSFSYKKKKDWRKCYNRL